VVSGRGLGPGNIDFFGPQMALAYRLDAISQGPNKSRFPGPNPPTCPRNGCCPYQKHYARGRINHRCIANLGLPAEDGSGVQLFRCESVQYS
jgi:hypothetical protein